MRCSRSHRTSAASTQSGGTAGPQPLPSAVGRGHFGEDEHGPIRPTAAEVRAIAENCAERPINLLEGLVEVEGSLANSQCGDRTRLYHEKDRLQGAYQSAIAVYEAVMRPNGSTHTLGINPDADDVKLWQLGTMRLQFQILSSRPIFEVAPVSFSGAASVPYSVDESLRTTLLLNLDVKCADEVRDCYHQFGQDGDDVRDRR